MTDGLLLLAVKKAKSSKRETASVYSPIHSGMFLLVLENMSNGTSKQSVLYLVHERLAQLLKLSSFSLINNLSSGRDKPSSRSARRNSARIVHITPGLLERDVRVRDNCVHIAKLLRQHALGATMWVVRYRNRSSGRTRASVVKIKHHTFSVHDRTRDN